MPKIWKSDSFASLAFKSKIFAQILKKLRGHASACPCVLEALNTNVHSDPAWMWHSQNCPTDEPDDGSKGEASLQFI